MLIGTATFFDAFDALTIAQVLTVLVAQWGINSFQTSWLISIGYVGQLIGAIFLSRIAERIGRVPTIVAAIILYAAMSIACMFAWGFWSLLVFRGIQGLGLGAQVPIAATYISELTKAHGRGRFVLLYELIFSVGVVAAGVAGFFIVPNLGWRFMFALGVLPILLVYFIHRFVPESPRWLASIGRAKDADTSMEHVEQEVSKASGQPLPKPAPVAGVEEPSKTHFAWQDLFRGGYARRTIIVWVMWFAGYIVYYGIGTWMPTLYKTVFHFSVVKALGYGLIGNCLALLGATLCALTIDTIGRRWWFTISLGGAGVFLAILAISGAHTATVVLVFGGIAYLFAGATSIGLYLYTPELYPTRARAVGVGTATAWLRLASILGPLIIGALVGSSLASIFWIFAAVSLAGAIFVAIFAMETKNQVLETLSP